MIAKKMYSQLIVIGLVGIIIAAACNFTTTVVVTATPPPDTPVAPTAIIPDTGATATPPPTALPTTPVPTDTPAPTAALVAQIIPAINANCRKGPGTGYDAITFLQNGTAYNVVGRNDMNNWWQVQATPSVICWIGDPNAVKQGPVDQVAIVMAPPLPGMPASFMNSFMCDSTLKTLSVTLKWMLAPDTMSYRLYRNGTLLKTLKASDLTYLDYGAPMKMELVYELEGVNSYGVGPRASTTVPMCK